ncbi:MAG: hypothetical protein ACLT8E_11505 [Akkermansia sp.]
MEADTRNSEVAGHPADSSAPERLCDLDERQQRSGELLQPGTLATSVGMTKYETVASVLWPILTAPVPHRDGDHSMPRHQAGDGLTIAKAVQPGSGNAHAVLRFQRLRRPEASQHRVAPLLRHGPRHHSGHSMKRSVFKLDDGTVQLGMRARTRGRLLPGFYLNPPLSNVIAGATLSTPYSLPPNLYLDESGFLAELQSSNHEQ